MKSGVNKSLSLQHGEIEIILVFWELSRWLKYRKDWKKIKWHWLLWMLRDMCCHSKRKWRNRSEYSQMWLKHWIYGSKCRYCGNHWKLSSLEEILLGKCHWKVESSNRLIRIGLESWKREMTLKRLFRLVRMICWRNSYQDLKRILNSVRRV